MNRWTGVFVVYLGGLVLLTFLPLDGYDYAQEPELRLQAFRTINFAFRKGLVSQQFIVLLGNLAVFIPLGMLLPIVSGRRSLLLVLAGALTVSIGIEVGQLAVSGVLGWAYRSADIDDVIVNVLGAVIGYVLLVLGTWLRPGRVAT